MTGMTDQVELILDGTKIAWHQDRIRAWERGERIAPITIDMALTRACDFAGHYCYAMLQENDRTVIDKTVIFDFQRNKMCSPTLILRLSQTNNRRLAIPLYRCPRSGT